MCVSGKLTRERLSTSSFLSTSNRAACCRACLCNEAASVGLNMLAASSAFHPLGSCSKARRSALLLLLDSVLLRTMPPPVLSFRLLGRPRSMMLADSDWFLRCPIAEPVRRASTGSALGVANGSGSVAVASLGVPACVLFAILSHGLGDDRHSIGADTGVGRVEVVMVEVAADRGVVKAESGVYGVLAMGESSVRAERSVGSTGVLPDRRRFRESCRVRRGPDELLVGITSGARFFGERGCRHSCCGRLSSMMVCLVTSSSARSSGVWYFSRLMLSAN